MSVSRMFLWNEKKGIDLPEFEDFIRQMFDL